MRRVYRPKRGILFFGLFGWSRLDVIGILEDALKAGRR